MLIVVLISCPVLGEDSWTKVDIDNDWVWAEDYIFAYAKYTVECEPGRVCQVGMGVSIYGEPRGEKIKFSGREEISVLGAGSLHFRTADGKGASRAAFILKEKALVKANINW
jgi:hypothetical protein